MNHTRGPMRVEEFLQDGMGWIILNDKDEVVAVVQEKPDAHLFAKAWEMVEAIEKHRRASENMDEAMRHPISQDGMDDAAGDMRSAILCMYQLIKEVGDV